MSNPYLSKIVTGLVTAALGGLITFITYSMAKPGGVYVIAWGAVIWGALNVLIGIYEYVRFSIGKK